MLPRGLLSTCSAQASHSGASCFRAQALGCARASASADCGLRSCVAWAWLLRGIFSRLGFKPVSPAWAGGFFTTEAPGKPRNYTEEEKKKRTESYLAGPTVTNADNWWVPHGGQNAVTRGVNTPPRRAQVSLARRGGGSNLEDRLWVWGTGGPMMKDSELRPLSLQH